MDLCEDSYIATLLLVFVAINIDVFDSREEGHYREIINMVSIFINIFLLKAIPPKFDQIPFFTSAMVLMLFPTKYWQMYLCPASGVLEGGFG